MVPSLAHNHTGYSRRTFLGPDEQIIEVGNLQEMVFKDSYEGHLWLTE